MGDFKWMTYLGIYLRGVSAIVLPHSRTLVGYYADQEYQRKSLGDAFLRAPILTVGNCVLYKFLFKVAWKRVVFSSKIGGPWYRSCPHRAFTS